MLIDLKKNVKTLADVSVLGVSIIKHVLAPACRQCFLTNKEYRLVHCLMLAFMTLSFVCCNSSSVRTLYLTDIVDMTRSVGKY